MAEEQPQFSEPDHPDYQRLQDLIQNLVEIPAQLGGFDIVALLAQTVDPQSVSYAAIARAVAFLRVKDPMDLQQRMDEVMAQALFWTEGFVIGSHFMKAEVEP
jgi:hypothetical protein